MTGTGAANAIQQLPFLCGPAALIELLRAKGHAIANNLELQIEIWRTANTVFMGDGLPGCSAAGLARAAADRGVALELLIPPCGFSFADTVRDPRKKEVITIIESLQRRDLPERCITSGISKLSTLAESSTSFRALMLISLRLFSRSNDFHWVYIERVGKNVRVVDPYAPLYENGNYLLLGGITSTSALCEILDKSRRHIRGALVDVERA